VDESERDQRMSRAAPLLVGIDVGTTRVKAGVIGLDGTELAHASVPTVWHRTATGAEAQPDDFLTAARSVLAAVLASAPPGPVAGVGVTSIAETAILLDGHGDPIGPAVAWYDRRASDDFAQLRTDVTPGEYGRRTGLGAEQIPTVATLRWLLRSHPRLRRAVHALSVAEWVVHGLGGGLGAEPSLASRTGALEITGPAWWDEALEWAGLPATLFGQLRPAGSAWGRARGGTGLQRLDGAVLTVAGHDHLVAAIGCGVTAPGQAMDSCGTAEAIVRAIPAATGVDPSAGLDRGVSCGLHVLPETRSLLAGLRLGIDLTPVLLELGVDVHDGHTSLDWEVIELLASDDRATGGSSAAQVWHQALRAAVARTVAALADVEQLGGPITEVRVSGGWAANPVLVALKAAALTNPVYPLVTEAGVRGAALLSGQAAGLFESARAFPPPELATPTPSPDKEMTLP
jgi:sugar (pentulose or hexulose) kinase